MSSIFEKKSFKLIVVGSVVGMMFLLVSGMALVQFMKIRAIEQAKEKTKQERLAYEDKFRQGMLRIRQNLKLDHFLAAYKNYQLTPSPKTLDRVAIDEYLEVLYRIAGGLLQNALLKESEEVFSTIREYQGQVDQTDAGLSQIESKRRLDSARLFLNQGVRLYEEKRYRDSLAELKKADQELGAVDRLKFDDIKSDWQKLTNIMREARFYVHLDDADKSILDAYRKLHQKEYSESYKALTSASSSIGKAAFLHPDAPEVKALRERLVTADSELSYVLPNSTPIWNHYHVEDKGKEQYYFYLDSYHFEPKLDPSDHAVQVGFQYYLESREARPFIVRYRITFYDNHDVFNGHFIDPGTFVEGSDPELKTLIFRQEIPDRLRALAVKRIELKIFNDKDEMVASIIRGFRKDSPM